MDKRYVERKLEVMKTVFEQNKEMAAGVAGPAVMEIFGETPFSPEAKETAPAYDEAQRELDLLFSSRSGQITNEYIKGEERSFTIVAYPVPEIGADYAKIFSSVNKTNTISFRIYICHLLQCLLWQISQMMSCSKFILGNVLTEFIQIIIFIKICLLNDLYCKIR